MAVSEEDVLVALRTVNDPDLQRDLVSLNMIRDLKIGDNGEVSLTVMLTTPACPLKAQIESDVKAAVTRVAGVKKVLVNMGANVTSTLRPQDLATGVRNIIGVASGKGGVGKSTVSVNLAIALAQSGARVGLLDADIYGPNIPLMLGVTEEQPQLTVRTDAQGNEIEMMIPVEKHGLKIMSMGFLVGEDTPVIWRGPMLNSALKQFLGQVDWGELDYLVVDLPPGTGDVQISLIQLVKITGIVHVTTPQAVAVQDVRKGIMMFESQKVPLLGIVENMSYFISPKSGERTDIFGTGGGENVARIYGIPFLGQIPLEPPIREGGDSGVPVVIGHPNSESVQRFRQIAEQLAAQVSVQNFTQAEREPSPIRS
ncbi:MAG: Mrp/NBP35 family ATP-binding protein [Candidatus Sumerlaeaceae bacterium]|nr:Mrp/NBP35 family ATP-binding protein [Candidatus Sumerlaeaceae bacterium]